MKKFKQHLEDSGLEPKTISTYVNAITYMCKKYPKRPYRMLFSKNITKATKTTYRIALKRWATFNKDEELLATLASPKVIKALSMRDGKTSKTARQLTANEVQKIVDGIYIYKEDNNWIWPCLMIMLKLGLRANVDLTRMTREAILHAIDNREILTIMSKRNKERDLPASVVMEELNMLAQMPDWDTLADLISPHGDPERRNEAAYEAIRNVLKHIAVDVGLDPKHIRTHAFRHAAAAQLLSDSDGDVFLVRDLLGHTSIQTTERYLKGSRTVKVGELLKDRFAESSKK